jgi:hypothetical protein
MSRTPLRNENSERESLENQIDRLNNKMMELFNNSSIMNCTENETLGQNREFGIRRTIDETEFGTYERMIMVTDE